MDAQPQSSMSRKQILLVDDHALLRSGLRLVLDDELDCDCREVESAEDALDAYRTHPADLVIMDLNMPGIGGLEGIRRLHAIDPHVRILVLSMHQEPDFVFRVRELGATGYVTKRSVAKELLLAVRATLAGKEYISSDLVAEMADAAGEPVSNPISSLSSREFEIFILLAQGHSVTDIAGTLTRSPKTINNHRSNILHKLGVDSTVQLTRLAIRHGALEP